jgi:chromosome segregation ATPase
MASDWCQELVAKHPELMEARLQERLAESQLASVQDDLDTDLVVLEFLEQSLDSCQERLTECQEMMSMHKEFGHLSEESWSHNLREDPWGKKAYAECKKLTRRRQKLEAQCQELKAQIQEAEAEEPEAVRAWEDWIQEVDRIWADCVKDNEECPCQEEFWRAIEGHTMG